MARKPAPKPKPAPITGPGGNTETTTHPGDFIQ